MNPATEMWHALRRAMDRKLLWPTCWRYAKSLDHARAAFAMHALHDTAWLALGDGLYGAIDALTPPPGSTFKIRCGDTVRHKPSGEEWQVAYADYAIGYMSWADGPQGMARIEECELINSCSDFMHRTAVAGWEDMTGTDHRRVTVLRLYGRPE